MRAPGLVACDIDGTLLDPTERVSDRTAAVIRRMRSTGTPFVLVSGRPPRWIPQVAEAIAADGYAVCGNGAVLYDIGADRVVSARLLQPAQLAESAAALDAALPGCALAAERSTITAHVTVPPLVAEPRYRHPWRLDHRGDHDQIRTVPRDEVIAQSAMKLLVRKEDLPSGELAAIAGQALGDDVDVTFSTDAGLIEVALAGVTKATGLAEVVRGYGLTSADVLAFGDMPNDLSMLRWAGHGVAMANAHRVVRAAADEITASNAEDGVAAVLERWF
ncbi:MAG: HAD family phosphatase [Sciscionella sp.]|nr:HAD family phosphatase [Sciscionella sp.]